MQATQVLVLAPTVAEAGPGAQAVQAARPVVGATVELHVPAGQLVHVIGPEPPAGTLSEYLPATQFAQVAAEVWPVAAEKVPLGQLVQSVMTLLPVVVEYVPAGQARQSAAAPAPTVVEYVPAAQAVHVAADVADVAVE